MCDAVYLNALDNFKQWYNFYKGENQGQLFFYLNTVILTKVKVQSINDVALTTIASNELRGDAIRLVHVYVLNDSHDKISETIFLWNN